MKNLTRIPRMLYRINKVWEKNSELTLGQLIGNVIDPKYLYEISDEKLMELLGQIYDS